MKYNKELYTQKLHEFFNRHDPTKTGIVDEIVEKFPNRQEEVFNHLTKIYAEKEGVADANISNDTIFSIPPTPNTGIA
ncbi:MAG: hypothetical protein WED10_07020 [Brumimicrobium sp.]